MQSAHHDRVQGTCSNIDPAPLKGRSVTQNHAVEGKRGGGGSSRCRWRRQGKGRGWRGEGKVRLWRLQHRHGEYGHSGCATVCMTDGQHSRMLIDKPLAIHHHKNHSGLLVFRPDAVQQYCKGVRHCQCVHGLVVMLPCHHSSPPAASAWSPTAAASAAWPQR